MTRRICRCCGSSFQENRCPICGFPYINALDEAGEAQIQRNASEYKENLLKGLTDFSIESYRYVWNESAQTLKLAASEPVFVTNGSQCHKRIVWSKENFGQYPENKKPFPLSISYKVNGQKKTLSLSIPPTKTSDCWHIGMEINDELRLIVYLGSKTNHTKSQPMQLSVR